MLMSQIFHADSMGLCLSFQWMQMVGLQGSLTTRPEPNTEPDTATQHVLDTSSSLMARYYSVLYSHPNLH